jgi:hypothetical protein
MRWNDFLFLITDDRDFRPQTCTNGLVFRECKHIKNIFEDVHFTKNLFHITLTIMENLCTNKNHSYKDNEQIHKQNIYNSECFGVKFVKIYPEIISREFFEKNMVLVDYIGIFFTFCNTFDR